MVYYVERLMESKKRQVVNVIGPTAAGKSMALRHLRQVFGEEIRLLDDVRAEEDFRGQRFVVIASERRHLHATMVLELEPWGEDDVIEYLLATHREKCGSVMERWRRAGTEQLDGVPGFVVPVLEEFVQDEGLADVDAGVRRFVRGRLGSDEDYVAATRECMQTILQKKEEVSSGVVAGHPYVVTLLGSEGLAREILAGNVQVLSRGLPFAVIEKLGDLCAPMGRRWKSWKEDWERHRCSRRSWVCF